MDAAEGHDEGYHGRRERVTVQELALVISGTVAVLTTAWKLYDIIIGRQKSDAAQDVQIAELRLAVDSLKVKVERLEDIAKDVRDLQTKMGLFWRVVEDNMADLLAKANPISLTTIEQAAAQMYKIQKRHTPTDALKMLDKAISREMPNLAPDERASFSLIQSAIRAQLVDRREYPYEV